MTLTPEDPAMSKKKIREEWKQELKEDVAISDSVSSFTIVREIIIGIILRVVSATFFAGYLQRRPELVTALTSFTRLREAVHLKRMGSDPYEGDLFHMQPLFLAAFDLLIDCPVLLSSLFMFFDVAAAILLRSCAWVYMRENKLSMTSHDVMGYPHLVFQCYLFNPLTIAACSVLSVSTFSNMLISVFFLLVLKRCALLSGLVTALLVHQNLHYTPLFIVQIFVMKRYSTIFKLMISVISTVVGFGLWNVLSLYLHGSHTFYHNTYGFSLFFPDLTPNVGIFWYHFCQVFEHFRWFFTWAFQLNYVVYVLPLAFTLRKNPSVYFAVTLILISTFAPYPSLADTCVYLAILPMFSDLRKYVRYTLIVGCTYASCLLLAPIMWKMWVITGSGNANFYFAVTLIYDVAQIFLATDLIYAHIRNDVRRHSPKGIDIDKAAAGFVCD